MKTTFAFPKWFPLAAAVALLLVPAAPASAQSQTNRLRIGVYDSRAIAIAYCNSAEFQKSMEPLMTEFKKAKEEMNEKQVAELDARGKMMQRRLHEQGFSTGSVAGYMAKVKDSLPDVAKKAGVQVIVSKWELNYQSPEVEVVDVTNELVALFHPNERVLNMLKDLKTRPPLPMEEITDDMD